MPKTAKAAPPLADICASIKKLLKAYSPPLVATSDFETRYELSSTKEVVIAGRKRKGIAFAAVIIQSKYVGFYYMCVYCNPALEKKLGADLMKTLKGKSCFHITTNDPQMMSQIKEALKIGFDFYKKQGWV